MWGRPTSEATAVARGTNRVLVHRNELNEQQRPGTIVQLPQQVKGTGIRWMSKLVRKMTVSQDKGQVSCDGLLFYTGAFIRDHNLDASDKIPGSLKKLGVLFLTNHVDIAETCKGMVSTMRGTPVKVSGSGNLVSVRTEEDLGPPLDEDDLVEGDTEHFFFGGFVDFKMKTVRGEEHPAKVRANDAEPRATTAHA